MRRVNVKRKLCFTQLLLHARLKAGPSMHGTSTARYSQGSPSVDGVALTFTPEHPWCSGLLLHVRILVPGKYLITWEFLSVSKGNAT